MTIYPICTVLFSAQLINHVSLSAGKPKKETKGAREVELLCSVLLLAWISSLPGKGRSGVDVALISSISASPRWPRHRHRAK